MTAEEEPESEADWMAEAALYCQPHGEKHDAMTCLRLLAEAASASGQWSAVTDSCDCGDGYGCSHGTWVSDIHMSATHVNGEKLHDPEDALDYYRHLRGSVDAFSWDEAHYIVAAQPSVVLGLLDRIALLAARPVSAGPDEEGLRAGVEALLSKWERIAAQHHGRRAFAAAEQREWCADDLRALLAASGTGRQGDET